MDVVRALAADRGLTCVVGAGGKKTTLYALANELNRAVLTATVRIPIFDAEVDGVTVTDDPIAALDGGDGAWPLGLVPEREGDRYTGYDPETVSEIASAHDGPVLVKGDGARTREFKAPGDREPQIPAAADVVVPIASVAAVGEPLDEAAVHRPERVAALTDLDPGDRITADAVATVIAHPEGGLKGVPAGATVVPLLNKVDDADAEGVARRVAERFFDRLGDGSANESAESGADGRIDVPRAVLARMIEPTVVDVVERS